MIKIRVQNPDKYYGNDKGKNITINLAPGYTCLVGPNGAGKTTILTQIRDILMREKDTETGSLLYKVVCYDNVKEGNTKNFQQYLWSGNTELISKIMNSSEGEGIVIHLGEFASRCGEATKECIDKNKSLIILIDGYDSGTSIDKIYQFKDQFVDFIVDHCKSSGIDVYIIATANNYAMVDDNVDCIDVSTGKHRIFRTYNAFLKYVLSNSSYNGEIDKS